MAKKRRKLHKLEAELKLLRKKDRTGAFYVAKSEKAGKRVGRTGGNPKHAKMVRKLAKDQVTLANGRKGIELLQERNAAKAVKRAAKKAVKQAAKKAAQNP